MATNSDKTMPDGEMLFQTERQRQLRVYRERFPRTPAEQRQSRSEMCEYRDAQRLHYYRLWKDLDTESEQPDDLSLARLAIKDESPTTRPTVAIPRPPQTIDLDLLGRTN